MPKLRVLARLTRLLLVLLQGMLMASVIATGRTHGVQGAHRAPPALDLPVHEAPGRGPALRCAGGWRAAAAADAVGQQPCVWTDIPLLGMLLPLSFLSKAEVRHWPVAGWLAEKAGTLFIRRGGGDSQRLREQIAGQLGWPGRC